MKRKLVAVLSTVFNVRGGIPRFNQMLGLALDQLAPELDLQVWLVSQDDSTEDYRAHGAPWRHVTFVPGGGKYGTARRGLALAVRERPDLMLMGLLGMTPLALPCLPWLRRGFGFVAHGYECWKDHPLADQRPSRHFAARRACFALAVSGYTGRELVRLTGLAPGAVRLLPNTLEPRFETFDADEGRGADALELLTVSRLWKEDAMKGVDHTLEAFARLAPRFPQARYHVVGRGEDKPRLEQLARSLGLGPRVVFEQDLSDEELASRYRRAAFFVLPSGQEGFGIVFLEAMRFSKPCIGGDAGGTPEVIEDGRTGFLVPYGDTGRLEQTMERLLADHDLRARMGRAGRQRLVEQFTFDRFRERLAGHLRDLLS